MSDKSNFSPEEETSVNDSNSKRYRITLEYDGSDFFGWQIQPEQRTVQGQLEDALARLYGGRIQVYGSGRTDTGVHASGMVAHFDSPHKYTQEVILKAVNANLPPDVRITEIEPVSPDFHARFSARWRWYRYRLSRKYSPLGRQYRWTPDFQLDDELLKQAADLFIGEHDFTAFSKADPAIDDHRCCVHAAEWLCLDDEWKFHIVANRFLRHMVRQIVGSICDVARGKYSSDQISEALASKRKILNVYTAPAHGLCLMKVGYGTFPYLDKDCNVIQNFPFP
ncbi:tRNA pseudouridine(38-40) synthase TruA [candidate division LCP-89 bacterium B3_LCP]|uniref:tRNA pseudouridine synthase A n=1 Tax=candidate division LCP-89 bacterium B3_LCP TaxID=2012998 RepID=A0A532UZV7_UNCL8|nr:MAG: tRNA pseudouridine(38-40) synthase TruA [candidate division LCP-89 bacterium B3_LCP]